MHRIPHIFSIKYASRIFPDGETESFFSAVSTGQSNLHMLGHRAHFMTASISACFFFFGMYSFFPVRKCFAALAFVFSGVLESASMTHEYFIF